LEVAAGLAARAEAPLFDRKALEPLVHEFNPELGGLDLLPIASSTCCSRQRDDRRQATTGRPKSSAAFV